MNDSRTMSEGQKLGEMGNGKRVAIIFLALVVIGALVGLMTGAFHGRHIRRNAAALTEPIAPTGAARAPAAEPSPRGTSQPAP
jgi:hypothetical protein